jgi:SAM-dependent methyltransferase
MTDWSEGYVTDIEYTGQFYRELAPTYLAFVALMQGYHPPKLGKGATYCELGCGQGTGTAVLAAANPGMNFWGIDFNPAQIANAKRYAETAGLTNVTFLDYSFQQALEAPAGTLPQFDYIVLHGIYSWISPENRQYIIRFIDKHLKPGGLVYISYNCLPGWAPSAPVQRLVREHAKRNPARSDVQAQKAFGFLKTLIEAKAPYFTRNPTIGKQLEKIGAKDQSYLAHEYLNGHWHPMYHADVVDEAAGARLNYIGSATLTENLLKLAVPASMAKMIEEAADPVFGETLRDFASNKQFRRDVFIRGASKLNRVERSIKLNELRLSMMKPRAEISLKYRTPNGEVDGNKDYYDPILDALASGPKTISELGALPAVKEKGPTMLVQSLILLTHGHDVHPINAGEDGRAVATSRRFNMAAASRLRFGESQFYFVAPVAGTAVRATVVDALITNALASGVPTEEKKVTAFADNMLQRTGIKIRQNDAEGSVEKPHEALETDVQTFLKTKLPLWKALGIL